MKAKAKYLFMPQTCAGASFIEKEKVGGDGSAGDGWWIVSPGVKDMKDPAFSQRPLRQVARGASCRRRASTPTRPVNLGSGINYGFPVVQALAIAGQLDGGLTRTNFMLALRGHRHDATRCCCRASRSTWTATRTPTSSRAASSSSGTRPSRPTINQGNVIDLDGKSKLCAWNQATATCG